MPLHTLGVISPLCTPPLFLPSLKCSVPASSLFSPLLYCMLPFFFPFPSNAYAGHSSLFSPLFPRAPLLECHPELVSGSHYSIYPLSLFVKYMRCRNEFGMTIWCVWATKPPPPSPLKGEGACRKPARRQHHPFAMTRRGFVLSDIRLFQAPQ